MAEDKTFTQQEVDSIVKGRLADLTKKHDAYIRSLQEEHQEELVKASEELETLKSENGQLKDKALKVDELNQKLSEAEEKVHEFTLKEETAAFHGQLKELGVKEDRLDAFSKLLGEDKTEESIKALTEQFPEWLATTEEPKPSIVIGGNPQGTEPSNTDPFAAKLAKYN